MSTREKPPTTSFQKWVRPGGEPWARFVRTRSGTRIQFPGRAEFVLSETGQVLSCRPFPGVTAEEIRDLERSHVLPLVLSRHEKLVLHASAIDVTGGAIAFAGASGRGKSTLATSFATSGGRLISDDGLVAERRNGRFELLPTHPSVRLWADSEEALVGSRRSDAGWGPDTKTRIPAGNGIAYCSATRPLRRLYVLGDGSSRDIVIRDLAGCDALVELIRLSFLLDVDRPAAVAAHFDRLSTFVRTTGIYSLDFPRRYELLPAVRQILLRHRPSAPARPAGAPGRS